MRSTILTRIIFVLAVLALCAQGQDRFTARDVDTTPALVPATPTDVFTHTVYVEEITLTNTSTSDVICTIQDRQSTPRVLYSDLVFGKGSGKASHYAMRYNGRRMPNGITWSCSDGAAVVGYIQGKR